jgi:hypothetical protein
LQFEAVVTNGTAVAYFDDAVIKEASAIPAVLQSDGTYDTGVSDFIQSASNGKRYWRLAIALDAGGTFSEKPYAALALWGDKTELDYATSAFDPYEQDKKAKVNLSYGGYVTGVHTDYTERHMRLAFRGADTDLYDKVKDWWETHGVKNLFVGWETANNPDEVWLMRPETKFSNPFNQTGLYRDVTLNLTGRKE